MTEPGGYHPEEVLATSFPPPPRGPGSGAVVRAAWERQRGCLRARTSTGAGARREESSPRPLGARSGRCPWRLCAFSPSRGRVEASSTPAYLRYSDAGQAAAPAFVPGGKPQRGARVWLGGKTKRKKGRRERPGPSRKPALHPTEPVGPAGYLYRTLPRVSHA